MKDISHILAEAESQKEFVMIEPGFIELAPIIIKEMIRWGFEPVKWQIKTLSLEEAQKFYGTHKDDDYFDDLCDYMASGPSMGILCLNTRAADLKAFKEGIRKEYGKDDMHNVLHSSDDRDRRTIESNIYFKAKK